MGGSHEQQAVPTLASASGEERVCLTILGLEVEPQVVDVTSSSVSMSSFLCQDDIFDC